MGTLLLVYAFAGATTSVATITVIATVLGSNDAPTNDALASLIEERRQVNVIIVGMSVILLLASVLLMVGAVELTRRRRVAPMLLRAWAWSKVYLTPINCFLIYHNQWIEDQMVRATGTTTNQATTIIAIGVLLPIWMIAPAVFSLIWFARTRVKTEVSIWMRGM